MDIRILCLFVSSGLYDKLFARTEDSYRVCFCVYIIVCDLLLRH
jgi:hypothetical protein